jgi:lipoprotein-releasing system permease protein
MSGFSDKLKDRLHGVLSDVIVETERSDGFEEKPDAIMDRLANSDVGPDIAGMAPTVEVFALLQFNARGSRGQLIPVTKHVRVIGIDPAKQAKVGQFAEYLVRQKNEPNPSFALTKQASERFARNRLNEDLSDPFRQVPSVIDPFAPQVPQAGPKPGAFLELPDIKPKTTDLVAVPPPEVPGTGVPRLPGVILGYSLAHFRYKDPKTGQPMEAQVLQPGDDVTIATLGAAALKPVSGTFVVTDYFRSEMSEYDSSFVYVPLDELQRLRGMDDRATTIQVRLKEPARSDSMALNGQIVPEIQSLFHPSEARVVSWQMHQGPLLAAIDIERGILNLLLFMIVGVAGFSVLAIFTMIVGEKYRDIGILKSLGASDRGIMAIFLTYGLMLGAIGCALGTAAGLGITYNINAIEAVLTKLSGHQIFDRSVYYFDEIPTNVEPLSVLLVNFGATITAVIFSILPALRAARLHPVRALRFE